MDDSDSAQSLLLGKKFSPLKTGWFADAADIFVLLSSFLLTIVSIALIVLVLCIQKGYTWTFDLTPELLSVLQRAISALSTTTTSAVIVVVGKRYVLFKLARGGMRSRRVALYGRPSIEKLAYHLVRRGVELPLLALLAVWALGLATGLTANDVWRIVPSAQSGVIVSPFGPLDDPLDPPGSLLPPTSAQLSYVIASMCSGTAGPDGLINITGDMQLASGGPAGLLVYPPPFGYMPNSTFSASTGVNGFNVSMESLSSLPPTAQTLTCVNSTGTGFSTGQLWYEGSDNQTLTIIATLPSSPSLYRFNASAIILGGLLQSTGDATVFVLNKTTSQNVMSSNQWALDIASLVCNATYSAVGNCYSGSSLLDFAMWFNVGGVLSSGTDTPTAAGIYWSTALGMAVGAYSSVLLSNVGNGAYVSITFNDIPLFTTYYGIYVLMANVIVSVIMLVVAVKLRMASRLGGDFIDATRLLLDPLKNPELFNASFNTTVNALGNPNMIVRDDSEFLLAEQAPLEDGRLDDRQNQTNSKS